MGFRVFRPVSPVTFAVLAAVAASTVMAAGQTARPATRSDGRPALFTQVQVDQGKAVFERSCAGCHGRDLTGGAAPPLTGPAFQRSWSNPRVTLDDLFFIIHTTMP